MGRFFNTAGPCVLADHYTIDPLSRLTSVRQLIDNKRYFILHAPRQTGKTTTMLGIMEALNREGKYIALYINVEPAQAVGQDVLAANDVFLDSVTDNAQVLLPKEYWPSKTTTAGRRSANRFKTFLIRWCSELPKPLVLFIDEADALIGDPLLSLLRQLRSGYTLRPAAFPQSVALIGLRDIRDYRIFSGKEQRFIIGGSAFNIKDESLTMGSFSKEETFSLLAQHTAETGQQFTPEALEMIFDQTQGQPWLVNAVGRELCFGEHKVPDGRTITPEDVHKAIEILILRRDTHLDHLGDKLTELRVARIIEPILTGNNSIFVDDVYDDDLQYLKDLGLIRKSPDGLAIANPIYREIIPRQLTNMQMAFYRDTPKTYLKPDGKLDVEKMMELFIEFYKENGEILTKRKQYIEAAHHLAFMGWLQRLVNGGGYIRREYASGLKFIDMVILFAGEKFVFELKTEKNYKKEKALPQIASYARRMNVREGYLLVFRRDITDVEVIGQREELEHDGVRVHLYWI